jgi:ArsR family transcriptional regulator
MDEREEVQEFLYGLASETRQNILFHVFLDGQERTVGQVARLTGLGQPTTSEHLKILKRSGILTSRREGKEVFYRPDRARVLASLAHLTDLLTRCCSED